jgi:hypothetical protein
MKEHLATLNDAAIWCGKRGDDVKFGITMYVKSYPRHSSGRGGRSGGNDQADGGALGIKPAYLAADPAYGSPRHREHERKRSAQSIRTP